MEFREGGTARACMRSPDGHDMYRTCGRIVPIHLIDFVQNLANKDDNRANLVNVDMSPGFPMDVRSTVTFKAPDDERTETTVTEFGYTSDQFLKLSGAGLEECLVKLAESLSEWSCQCTVYSHKRGHYDKK
jgi:uncharacterized protein YndB with AHSA1/START domain